MKIPPEVSPHYSDVHVGDELALLKLEPVNRTVLALYAGASGDHNQVHIDLDFARKSRQPDVFAHGMLSAAYLGRLLTNWVPQSQIPRLVDALRRYNPARTYPALDRTHRREIRSRRRKTRAPADSVQQPTRRAPPDR